MPDPTIRRGSRVEHPRYGQGIVLEVFAAREDAVATVDWDERSTRYSPYLDTLTVVPDENAVRAVIAEARIAAAPHDWECALVDFVGLPKVPCDCWKSAALTDEQPAAECPECGDGPGCRCGVDWTAAVPGCLCTSNDEQVEAARNALVDSGMPGNPTPLARRIARAVVYDAAARALANADGGLPFEHRPRVEKQALVDAAASLSTAFCNCMNHEGA